MLANTRFCFPLTLLLVFSLAAWMPSAAQGVPASVTSIGFGGSNNPTPGVRASVTSLGSNGYAGLPFIGNFGNCCANFFLPYGFSPQIPTPLAPRRHRHHHDDDQTFVGVAAPVYIPYAVPYAAEPDDDATDYEGASDPGPGGSRPSNRPVTAKGVPGKKFDGDSGRDSGYESGRDAAPAEAAPEKPEEPVAVQPTTVLIFKDGHRSEVVNYAIVGDTLFNFADGRVRRILLADLDLPATRRTNDDLGVEFKLPTTGK